MPKNYSLTLFIKWLPYIIPFGFGIIFGYLLQIPSAFSIVISGISGGTMLGLITIFIAWFKERKSRRLKHSMLLVDRNLRSRTKTYIGFADYLKCDLRIQIKNLNYPTAPESDIYSKEVDAHIESGYENLLKIVKKREILISEHDAKAKQFLNDLKSKVMSELKQRIRNISEWNEVGQPQIKYFTEHLLFEIGCILQLSYEQTTGIGYYDSYFAVGKAIDQWQTLRWQISRNYVLVASDNEKEIQEIKQIIIGILVDAVNSEDFKILKNYFQDVRSEHSLFIKEINEIIKDIENDIHLNGRCRICQEF